MASVKTLVDLRVEELRQKVETLHSEAKNHTRIAVGAKSEYEKSAARGKAIVALEHKKIYRDSLEKALSLQATVDRFAGLPTPDSAPFLR